MVSKKNDILQIFHTGHFIKVKSTEIVSICVMVNYVCYLVWTRYTESDQISKNASRLVLGAISTQSVNLKQSRLLSIMWVDLTPSTEALRGKTRHARGNSVSKSASEPTLQSQLVSRTPPWPAVCACMWVWVCTWHVHVHLCVSMYLCIWVCIHNCVYVCVSMSLCGYKWVCVCVYGVCMSACVFIRVYVCLCFCLYVYVCVCVYVYIYVCACISVYLCMHVCVYLCISVCMYVCMCVSVPIPLCLYVCASVCSSVSAGRDRVFGEPWLV